MKAGMVDYLTWWGPYLIGLLTIVYAFFARKDAEEEPGGMPYALFALVCGAVVVVAILTGIFAKPSDLSWRYAVVFLLGGLCAIGASVFASKRDAVFFAIGLGLLETAFLRNYFRDAPMLYLYTNPLGAWLAAALMSYGSETKAAAGARLMALTTAVIAAVVAMGVFHYSNSGAGSLYGVDICAVTLLLCMAAAIAVKLSENIRAYIAPVAAIVMLVLIWWLGKLLGNVVIDKSIAGLCGFVGAAAVVLSGWLASVSKGDMPIIGRNEARVLVVLIAVAVVAMCMRLLAGYGIAIAAVCGLGVLPFMHKSDDNVGVCVVSALASVALVRAFLETTSGGTSVDIFESYTIPGLVLGGCLALMVSAAASNWRERGRPGALAGYIRGKWAVFFVAAVIFMVAYFWRADAISGMVLGISAGVFYSILMSADGVALAPGIQILIITLIPSFLEATTNLTRQQKIHVMLWTLGVAALIVICASAWRLIRGTGTPISR